MIDISQLRRIDPRSVMIALLLMVISLLIISTTTTSPSDLSTATFFTPLVVSQIKWFILGWGVYFFFAALDYQKLREWTWILYLVVILLLIGLYFTTPIQNVRRWYRLPFVNFALQPSEYAKLIIVMTLSWFLEKNKGRGKDPKIILGALCIVLVPFALILKQPDLGTAMVLFPIALVMFYFGGIHTKVVKGMAISLFAGICFITAIFLGIISHEEVRPVATKVLKEYQYERLNPNTYHQKASQTAIALGKWSGSGWRMSEYTSEGWLPAAHTDSVFAAFAEEQGFIGAIFLITLFFGLIYFSFQITAVAKDDFGRLLSAGVAAYLAIHVVLNVGMMCGFLPITGVPLILVSYGGSSVLSSMSALGILQSIYTKRFMFS